MKILVVVKLQHELLHSWPECPHEQVAFLRNAHRHVLHITARKEVSHPDREIEIIMLKGKMVDWLWMNFPSKILCRASCEDVALFLMEEFRLESCQVLEDGENGAEVHA